MYCILILHYITGIETTFGGYSKMLPSANALCVRLGVLLVCSMWKCRIQVLQRTMTSQTMCWCLAYSPLAVHDLAKERLNKLLRLVTRHSISKSAGNCRSQHTASRTELFCGNWMCEYPVLCYWERQMPRQSQKLPWPQWICAGFLLALKEERYSTMELRSKSHIVFGSLRSAKKCGSWPLYFDRRSNCGMGSCTHQISPSLQHQGWFWMSITCSAMSSSAPPVVNAIYFNRCQIVKEENRGLFG